MLNLHMKEGKREVGGGRGREGRVAVSIKDSARETQGPAETLRGLSQGNLVCFQFRVRLVVWA